MSIDDKLRAVATLDDMRCVLIEARAETPRVLDFNSLMREQHEADHLVRAQFPQTNATAVMERFAREHAALATSAEAANLATHPLLILAVARVMAAQL